MNSLVVFQDLVDPESQQEPQAVISRNKVKPWVFRPKKVVFSLEETQTTTRKQYSKSHWSQE